MRQHAAHNRIETAISTVPPDAPEEVVALSTRFSELLGRYSEQREQRKQAEKGISDGRGEDVRAAALAITDGQDPPKDANKHERSATVKAEAAKLQEEAHLAALDQAGDELAEAILAARDDWSASVRDQLAADVETYRESLATTDAALRRIQRALGVLDSLARFRVARHADGTLVAVDVRFTTGGRVTLDRATPISFNDPTVAHQLIEMLGTLDVSDALKPKPETTEVAA